MLYVGIDQHRKQLTVNVREESENVILRRQVSTEWKKVRAFFDEMRDLAQAHDGYLCVVEICGFNDWLVTSGQERYHFRGASDTRACAVDSGGGLVVGGAAWVSRR